jgi:hypothetical protein
MELGGDEKRIQALFSELSLADQKHAPEFEKLWRVREVTSPASRSRKPLVLVAATLLIAVAGLVAAWIRYAPVQTPIERNAQNVAPQAISTPEAPRVEEPQKLASVPRRAQNRHRHFVRQKQIERTLAQRAAMLARWQSPTSKFLESPTGSVFNSLPQLNQSVKDLESFLPKVKESIKESNQ